MFLQILKETSNKVCPHICKKLYPLLGTMHCKKPFVFTLCGSITNDSLLIAVFQLGKTLAVSWRARTLLVVVRVPQVSVLFSVILCLWKRMECSLPKYYNTVVGGRAVEREKNIAESNPKLESNQHGKMTPSHLIFLHPV